MSTRAKLERRSNPQSRSRWGIVADSAEEIRANHAELVKRNAYHRRFGYDPEASVAFVLGKALPLRGRVLDVGTGKGRFVWASRWTRQLDGGHVTSARQNQVSLGICLVGNFCRHEPTPKQLERLRALVQALMRRCELPASAVTTHQQINVLYTRCPGRHFPTKRFLASLESDPIKSK
jgi:hypothetical protein